MSIQSQQSLLKSQREQMEVLEIRQNYAEALKKLTCNTKKLIDDLSKLANENGKKCPDVIVKLIEDRIRYVRTLYSLFIHYLIIHFKI